ncbi:autophagy protein 5 [Frankliniella occidentalis]|uniref:Autophagy protein 5 n=1 Tax=Frankliniella occidentalis TaxID=133901 RepID=A0A6J1SYJ2_FRAOC|nr:autophagy protein 5 [Frankliniella occidentalis]
MANDREVLREIWDGRVPVCFQLDSSEVNGLQAPDPYYLMVPRLSYFPLVTDKVRRHFQRYIHPDKHDAEMWVDFNGQPLKWHYPIGVLFDLHIPEISLPWCLTIHFDKFPEAELLHCSSREAVESYFMSCIKEADVLKHRSQVVSNMQKKDHNQLWLGLQNDKFDQFWAVNRKLMEVGSDETFKYIPFRLYQGDEPFIQRLVKPVTEEGQRKTLFQFLQEIYAENASKVKVTTHGVEPPSDTPLQWMSEHLSYPDNFLHLCVAF